MYRLSLVILILFNSYSFTQSSPHGVDFKVNCLDCHSQDWWKVIPNKIKFDHNTTNFKLEGEHSHLECRACHKDLRKRKQNVKIATGMFTNQHLVIIAVVVIIHKLG